MPTKPESEPRVLTEADIRRIWLKFGDPSAVYRCICGMAECHVHTESCREYNRKRIEEHRKAKEQP